jgi:hypothetical protein
MCLFAKFSTIALVNIKPENLQSPNGAFRRGWAWGWLRLSKSCRCLQYIVVTVNIEKKTNKTVLESIDEFDSTQGRVVLEIQKNFSF